MNRAERRRIARAFQKQGMNLSQEKINAFCNEVEYFRGCVDKDKSRFNEGDKVKINYERIIKSADYPNFQEKYKSFVEAHKGDIFTVEYEERYAETQILSCFKEDDTNPKWLWAASDLIPVNKELIKGETL